MGKVFEGDSWKQACDEPICVRPSPRAEQQETADRLYAAGVIDLEDWRQRCAHLSSVDATGRTLGGGQ